MAGLRHDGDCWRDVFIEPNGRRGVWRERNLRGGHGGLGLGSHTLVANLLGLCLGHAAGLPDTPRARTHMQAGSARRARQGYHHRQQQEDADREKPPRAQEESRHTCQKSCQRCCENCEPQECHCFRHGATLFASGPACREVRFQPPHGELDPPQAFQL